MNASDLPDGFTPHSVGPLYLGGGDTTMLSCYDKGCTLLIYTKPSGRLDLTRRSRKKGQLLSDLNRAQGKITDLEAQLDALCYMDDGELTEFIHGRMAERGID